VCLVDLSHVHSHSKNRRNEGCVCSVLYAAYLCHIAALHSKRGVLRIDFDLDNSSTHTSHRVKNVIGMKFGLKRVAKASLSHTPQRVKSQVMLAKSLYLYDHDDRVSVDPVEKVHSLNCILYWLAADTPSNECKRTIKTRSSRVFHSLCGV